MNVVKPHQNTSFGFKINSMYWINVRFLIFKISISKSNQLQKIASPNGTSIIIALGLEEVCEYHN